MAVSLPQHPQAVDGRPLLAHTVRWQRFARWNRSESMRSSLQTRHACRRACTPTPGQIGATARSGCDCTIYTRSV